MTSERGPPGRIISDLFSRGFKLVGLLFLLELVVIFAVVNVPFLPGEQQQFSKTANGLTNLTGSSVEQVAWTIFAHNSVFGIQMVVPVYGDYVFADFVYVNARVEQAVAVHQGMAPTRYAVLLLALPHAWIELPAYALAAAESIYILSLLSSLAYSAARRLVGPEVGSAQRYQRRPGAISREARLAAIVIAAVVAELAIASVFEAIEIKTLPYGFLMWVPFGVLLAGFLLVRRRYKTADARLPT